MEAQSPFEVFVPLELQVLISRLEIVKGFPFKFELRNKIVQEKGSYVEGSKNPII